MHEHPAALAGYAGYRLAFVGEQLGEMVVVREPSGVRRLPRHAGHTPKLLSNFSDPKFKQGSITSDEMVCLARDALGIEVCPPVERVRIWIDQGVNPDGESLPVLVVAYPRCCQVGAGIYRKFQASGGGRSDLALISIIGATHADRAGSALAGHFTRPEPDCQEARKAMEALEVLAMHELYLLRATLAPGLLQEVSSLVRAMAYLGDDLSGDRLVPLHVLGGQDVQNTHITHIAPVQALHSRSEHVRMA